MTLNELKTIWQDRLTTFGIASMPWEPEPTATTKTDTSFTTAPDRGGTTVNFTNRSQSEEIVDATVPKKEPTEGSSFYLNTGQAALRAAQNIQQFAQEKQAEISGVDSKDGIQNPTDLSKNNSNGSNGGGLVLPGGGHLSQVDGAVIDGQIPATREEIDELIAKRALSGTESMSLSSGLELEIEIPPNLQKKLAQHDGVADDDDDDDDDGDTKLRGNDINSDLDDSDDELNFGDEEESEEQGMIMLCLYDKVQRVKNKWKYVLKDGVANINGKDYVFSRAQGESEW